MHAVAGVTDDAVVTRVAEETVLHEDPHLTVGPDDIVASTVIDRYSVASDVLPFSITLKYSWWSPSA